MSILLDSLGRPVFLSGGAIARPAAGGGGGAQSVLTPADFTYLGYLRVPLDYNTGDPETSIRMATTYGAMTGRYVGGDLHLFMCQGWGGASDDELIELVVSGEPNTTMSAAPRLAAYKVWGNIYGSGLRAPINTNTSAITNGLHWDGEKLLWSWGPQYALDKDRSLGATTFTGTTSKTVYGTWRTQEHPKRVNGYMTKIPEAFANAYLGGARVGIGGPISSLNDPCAWGAWLSAFDSINLLSTPPSSYSDQNDVAVPTTTLLGWPQSNKMPRNNNWRFCDWNVLYDCAQGSYVLPASGVVSDIDTFSGCSWIDTPTKRGLVYFGAMADVPDDGLTTYPSDGVPHVWYAPGTRGTCCHGHGNGTGGTGEGMSSNSPGPNCETHVPQMWIFDPNDLASGLPTSRTPTTSHCQMRTQFGANFPRTTAAYRPFGNSWYDEMTGRLYLVQLGWESGAQFEVLPVIQVFQVAG